MILDNFTVRRIGEGQLFGAVNNPTAWKRLSTMHAADVPDDPVNYAPYNSIPSGTEPPYAFFLALEGGELTSSIYLSGSGNVSGTMILTRDLAANLSGSGTVQGSLSLLTTLTSTLTGSGSVSGSLALLIALASTLAGGSDLTADMKLRLNFESVLGGSGTISANLVGYANLEATIYVNAGAATIDEIVDGVVDGIGSITATIPDLLNTETGDIIIPLE